MKLNLKDIPKNPGIYFFLNNTGKIIYIGKAKNLKSRLSSYWQKSGELTEQKKLMLTEIAHIRYTLVDNETESLLLEANQIKKYQPKYNIVLKDGESATEDEIISYCTANLTKYKVPKKVEFRKELPKSLIGKVLKKVLKEEERSKKILDETR